MASNSRRLMTIEDVLGEIFEDSDFSDKSDIDYDDDDSLIEQIVQQVAENVPILREFPMEQSPNLQNHDIPFDVENGWSSVDDDRFVMPFTEDTGLGEHLPDVPVALDFFKLRFGDEMRNVLTQQTNLYATHSLAMNQLKPQRMQKWTPVTVDEMKVFFSLIMAMGLSRKSDINPYWSTRECNSTPFFGSRMSKDRFHLINVHACLL